MTESHREWFWASVWVGLFVVGVVLLAIGWI